MRFNISNLIKNIRNTKKDKYRQTSMSEVEDMGDSVSSSMR